VCDRCPLPQHIADSRGDLDHDRISDLMIVHVLDRLKPVPSASCLGWLCRSGG
jgi:hypothetical protein